MKVADIITQLASNLPRLSTEFSDPFSVVSMTRAGATVTVVTATPHKLVTGKYVTITGAESPVQITSLTQALGVASAVTAEAHDLTEDWDAPVKVTGADQAGYDLSFNMKDTEVPNRLNFSYNVDPTTVSPATGANLLLFDGKDRGYNGLHQVTVVNATTFTYTVTTAPLSPAAGTPVIHTGVRVGGAITIERFMKLYSKQPADAVWAVVVMGETTASASRYIDVDSVDVFAGNSDYRQSLVNKFSVFLLIPCKAEIAGIDARDSVEDLKAALFKSLIGVKFPSYLTSTVPDEGGEPASYGVVLDNHGFHGYTEAFYVHQFTFQTLDKLVIQDAVDPGLNVAFRDINLVLQNALNDDIMTTAVNLDDEPVA